jgi:hypothetical protein
MGCQVTTGAGKAQRIVLPKLIGGAACANSTARR